MHCCEITLLKGFVDVGLVSFVCLGVPVKGDDVASNSKLDSNVAFSLGCHFMISSFMKLFSVYQPDSDRITGHDRFSLAFL